MKIYMIFDGDGVFKGIERIPESEVAWYKENGSTLITGAEALHTPDFIELAQLCMTDPVAGSSRLWVEEIQLKASQILSSIKECGG